MVGWRQFEIDVKYLCEALGYASEVTSASGDFGVDVIGRRGSRTVAIQCKLYENSVGCEPIQRLLASQRLHGATDFLCITSGRFTKKAKELGHRAGVILVDGKGLEQACRTHGLVLPSCSYTIGIDGEAFAVRDQDIVGRNSAETTVVLNNPLVSRKHALFRFHGLRLVITDLGSTNGTKINSKLIASGIPTSVTYDDKIEFADSEFILQLTQV